MHVVRVLVSLFRVRKRVLQHLRRLIGVVQVEIEFGERAVELELIRLVLDRFGEVRERVLLVVGPEVSAPEIFVAVGHVGIGLDALLERLLRLFPRTALFLGEHFDRSAAPVPIVGELRRDRRGPRHRRRQLVPGFLLLVRHAELEQDPMVGRVELRGLLVLGDGAVDIDVLLFIGLIGQVDGFDGVATATRACEDHRRHQHRTKQRTELHGRFTLPEFTAPRGTCLHFCGLGGALKNARAVKFTRKTGALQSVSAAPV